MQEEVIDVVPRIHSRLRFEVNAPCHEVLKPSIHFPSHKGQNHRFRARLSPLHWTLVPLAEPNVRVSPQVLAAAAPLVQFGGEAEHLFVEP